MNEILGMLAALESVIESGSRMPFSNKRVVEEDKIVSIIRKIKRSIEQKEYANQKEVDKTHAINPCKDVQNALEKAAQIESGAREYADYVLASLQLVISKMQKDLVKLEKNIDSGRELLEKPSHETR